MEKKNSAQKLSYVVKVGDYYQPSNRFSTKIIKVDEKYAYFETDGWPSFTDKVLLGNIEKIDGEWHYKTIL